MALGIGQNGYLALMSPPAAYNTIPSSKPYRRPEDLGPFIPTSRRFARIITRGQAVVADKELTEEDITLHKFKTMKD